MSDAPKLFSDEQLIPWIAEWKDMPEFELENLEAKFTVLINFATASDVEEFARLIGASLKANGEARYTQSIWFPDAEIGRIANKRYIEVA